MTATRARILLLLTTAIVTAAWWRVGTVPHSPKNVVLITLDTTRADRLSPYGFMDAEMPALERLAREGVVFDRASSVAPLTLPAHASLFTGLIPPAHGVRDNGDAALREEHVTLAELLAAQGFRTAAFVGSVVLDADRGLAQGFQHYSSVGERTAPGAQKNARRADEVIKDAISWVDQSAGSRFFLWTHLYDPHRPYDAPEPFRSQYADPYIGEIAFVDSQIGRLLQHLETKDLLKDTVVIVVGDHGESLGEHGERDHGVFVYESVLRVPLIIRAPGVSPGRTSEVVRVIDVMPTVLQLLKVKPPAFDGVSLVDVMNGRRRDLELQVYAESLYPQRLGWSPLRALRDGRYKLIDAPRPELYDLDSDPFEQRNLFAERADLARALRARLASLEPTTPSQREPVSPELQRRLAALGYVGSAGSRRSTSFASLPDPKDCMAFSQLSTASAGLGTLPGIAARRQSSTGGCQGGDPHRATRADSP